jgi:hypothetical protein
MPSTGFRHSEELYCFIRPWERGWYCFQSSRTLLFEKPIILTRNNIVHSMHVQGAKIRILYR